MFRKMPIILLGLIFLIFITESYIPLYYKSVLYALSLTIKSIIICILPFIIFMLLFKTIAKLSKNATKIIILILIGVCCSNFISTMISYLIGKTIFNSNLSVEFPKVVETLGPAWIFSLPKLIGNDYAMFLGIISAVFFSLFAPHLTKRISHYFEITVGWALRAIICVIPLFITGFIIKLIYDGILEKIIHHYALIFSLITLALFSYIALLYLIANRFQIKPFFQCIKNMLPAAISGFGSMSSAATMPLTIIGTERNTKNQNLTDLVIPATVNVHLMADCFAIPIFAFAVLKNFGLVEPAFSTYLLFAFYFVIAKFSVAAIPGGGILVMLPILESQLGFNADMASLITALYILFDPVITCGNVLGNGAFALLLSKLVRKDGLLGSVL